MPKDPRVAEALLNKYAETEEWQRYFTSSTHEIKRISQYTGLNFNEVLDLPYSLYLLYRKESWIDSWRGSEDGVEFLKDIWRLEQTEMNEEAVRAFNKQQAERG